MPTQSQNIFKLILQKKNENNQDISFYQKNADQIKRINQVMESVNRDFSEKDRKSQDDARDVILNS